MPIKGPAGTGVDEDGIQYHGGTPIPHDVTIAYAASSTTDGIDVTFTVVDRIGTAIAATHVLEIWISDDSDGHGLTATGASGALTPGIAGVLGNILTAYTAKKHISATTNAGGVLVITLVDLANTAGERFCCRNPSTNRIVLGAATVAGDYEGG